MSDKIMELLSEIKASVTELSANQKNNYRAIQDNTKLLKEQGETLLRNTITVEHHEKRSTLLEQELKSVREELEPIKEHVQQVSGAGKLIRWTGITVGAILALIGLITALQKFL